MTTDNNEKLNDTNVTTPDTNNNDKNGKDEKDMSKKMGFFKKIGNGVKEFGKDWIEHAKKHPFETGFNLLCAATTCYFGYQCIVKPMIQQPQTQNVPSLPAPATACEAPMVAEVPVVAEIK